MKKLSIVCLTLLLVGGFAFAADGILQAEAESVEFSMEIDGGTFGFDSASDASVSGSAAFDYDGELVAGGLEIGLIPNIDLTESEDAGDWVFADYGISTQGATDSTNAAFTGNSADVAAPYDALGVLYNYANTYYPTIATSVKTNYPSLFDGDDLKDLDVIIDDDTVAVGSNDHADELAKIANAVDELYDSLEGKVLADPTAGYYGDSQDAWDALLAEAFGGAVDASAALSFPISGAYLKLKNVADVADVTFVLSEGKFNAGSMVAAEIDDKPLGISVSLVDGLIENASASAFVGMFPKSTTDDDLATVMDETDEAAAVWSMMMSGGYDLAVEDLLNASVAADFAVTDFAAADETWFLSMYPSVSMADMFDLALDGEFSLKAGDGMAAGANLGASIAGFSPSFAFTIKNADWGGDGSSELAQLDVDNAEEAVVDDEGSAAYFSSIDEKAAMRIAAGISADLAEYVGYAVTAGFDFGYASNFDDDPVTDWAVNAGFSQDALSVAANYASTKDYGLSADYVIEYEEIPAEEEDEDPTMKERAVVSGGVNYVAEDEKFVTSVGLTLSL